MTANIKRITLSLLALLPIATASARADDSGWCLKQISISVGKQNVSISPKYLRVENEKAGTITYASAPDWKVYTVNRTRKIYFVTTPQAFTAKFAFFTGSLTRSNLGAMHFNKGEVVHEKTFTKRRYTIATSKNNRFLQNDEQIWSPSIEVIDDPRIPKEPLMVLDHFFNLPDLPGVPYYAGGQVESANLGTKTRQIVRTVSVCKCAVKPGIEVSLAGLRKTKDEHNFATENNATTDLKDLTDYIGN